MRSYCAKCKKPLSTCYCSAVSTFESSALFAILMHKEERRKAVATGRMAHLCLTNSLLFEGINFTEHDEVNALIQDPRKHCIVLAPGPHSVNLSKISIEERQLLIPIDKQPVVFVIDGTWSQARTMRRLSKNLQKLTSFCFSPAKPSAFLVRKQPAEHCYSTIEAIHTYISLMNPDENPVYNHLLTTLSFMVNQQIKYEEVYGTSRGFRPTRGVRNPAGRV
jgi:DTW domain-containing protein